LPSRDTDRRGSAADRRARRIAAEVGRAFEIQVRREPNSTILELTGEFDASCVLRYERQFRETVEDPPKRVVIDMRQVTFIDSTGIALLLRSETASRQDGFKLQILRSPAAAVQSALEASGLERLLPFVEADA
jgi:anti-anti-sigma factor